FKLAKNAVEAHVLEAPVAVKVVKAAVVEIDDVAAHRFPVRADAGRGQFSLDGVFRELERLAVESGERALHLAGDVADSLQPVDLDLRAARFLFAAAR